MKIELKHFGPIKDISLQCGDLTILIGPQASGKSVVLQMLKLLVDKQYILSDLNKYGYNTMYTVVLDTYLGSGMGGLWTNNSKVLLNGIPQHKNSLKYRDDIQNEKEQLFYIPAQRILSVNDGRPKNFMEFDNTTPYVLRHFSESIRLMLQNGLGDTDLVFPISTRLKQSIIDDLNSTVFHDSKIVMENRDGQKKMRMKVGGSDLPFMTWSAGQKEFVPLLMGLYCVSGPPNKIVNKDGVDYVIIEEPEMGLHPRAILTVMLQILLLIDAGKKVILSTHSSIPLEFAWAYHYIVKSNIPDKAALIGALFGLSNKKSLKMFAHLENLDLRVHYFKREADGVVSSDITRLDVSSNDTVMSEWGGITAFSSVANEIVCKVVNHEE